MSIHWVWQDEANKTNATQLVVPYLNGRWKVNYRYVEMKGNVGQKSGCVVLYICVIHIIYVYPYQIYVILFIEACDESCLEA
jgi:hypothetical protein